MILGVQRESRNAYYLNGLKARSSKVFDIEVFLDDPSDLPGMYKNYNGSLETIIEYPEFASSSGAKN